MIGVATDALVAHLMDRLDGCESFVEIMNDWCGGGLLVRQVRVANTAEDGLPLQQREVAMAVRRFDQTVASAESAVALNHLTPDAYAALNGHESVLGAVLRAIGHRRKTLDVRRLAKDPIGPDTAVIEVRAQMVNQHDVVSARIIETVYGRAFLFGPAIRN